MGITKSIRELEHEIDLKAEKFLRKHPFPGFLAIFVGIPILVLACVCICTVAIAFPMAWVLGWF